MPCGAHVIYLGALFSYGCLRHVGPNILEVPQVLHGLIPPTRPNFLVVEKF